MAEARAVMDAMQQPVANARMDDDNFENLKDFDDEVGGPTMSDESSGRIIHGRLPRPVCPPPPIDCRVADHDEGKSPKQTLNS
jgi:hypothetical protein